jgi:hypothetical protein
MRAVHFTQQLHLSCRLVNFALLHDLYIIWICDPGLKTWTLTLTLLGPTFKVAVARLHKTTLFSK